MTRYGNALQWPHVCLSRNDLSYTTPFDFFIVLEAKAEHATALSAFAEPDRR